MKSESGIKGVVDFNLDSTMVACDELILAYSVFFKFKKYLKHASFFEATFCGRV
jgi:hypothetical protein